MRAVVELASFSAFSVTHLAFLDQITESIGLTLSTIEGSTLTETLLVQSQSLADELRSQQEELRESNEDLGRQARLLAEQNTYAEQKNQEVEQSKRLLEEKAGQLAVSSKYKSEFIANMSHELRTPLNSLLMLAEQLQDNAGDTMTDVQVEYATVILASGRDLLGLLNGILELAKAESGTVVLELSDVSIENVRSVLVREFEHVAQAKGLAYSVHVEPDVPASLLSDTQRLRQILTNLLANAFKFTETGEVQLRVHLADAGWSPETASLVKASAVVAFSVSDSGIGIGRAEQRRIFEAFAQGDGSTARRFGGTGLGLSISRELVGVLGGEITVSSTPGDGSTFTVYLPLGERVKAAPVVPLPGPVESLQPPQVTPLPPPAIVSVVSAGETVEPAARRVAYTLADGPFEGRTILVVDDDFRNIFAMTALLERGDAAVVSAESGPDAIAMLQESPGIDLVLMDIMMPEMDGYATMRAIRAQAQFATLPIIAVTGKVVSGERERCVAAGANDYVPKPVDVDELLAAIGPWLPPAIRVAA